MDDDDDEEEEEEEMDCFWADGSLVVIASAAAVSVD